MVQRRTGFGRLSAMNKLADAINLVAVTLWVGGLWTVGLIVAPLLFRGVTDRSLAGALAGQFFAAIAFVGIGCGLYLLIYRLVLSGAQAPKQPGFWILLLMLALTVAGQFGVQPILAGLKQQALPGEVMASIFRDRFAAWHGVSGVLYLIECVLGLALVLLPWRGK